MDREPAGIVALAPMADLREGCELNLGNGAVVEFLGGTPETVPERYEDADPTRNGSSVRRCLIHGDLDNAVPLTMSESFVKARCGNAVLITIKGANHFDLIDPESAAWQVVKDRVISLLAEGR
jgi:hypothetical protein